MQIIISCSTEFDTETGGTISLSQRGIASQYSAIKYLKAAMTFSNHVRFM